MQAAPNHTTLVAPGATPHFDERRLISRIKELSSDSLEGAIERGCILKTLNLAKHEYESKKIGISFSTGYRLIALVDHPRMQGDWQKPALWTVCYELLQVSDKLFDAMLAAGFVGYHTTRRQVRDYVRTWKRRRVSAIPTADEIDTSMSFHDQVLCGDCIDLISSLPDKSINAVVTSPPYAEQRKGQYEGVSEENYPEWFTQMMDALQPKLTDDGSVLVVIRSHVSDGQVSDYIMRTRLAVRQAGWIECEELIWYKPDSPPLGSILRPRRAFEQILWFSKARQPFVNLTAGGRRSDRVGFEIPNQNQNQNLYKGTSPSSVGTSRVTDVFTAGVSKNESGIDHPAIYPVTLCTSLIETFSRPGDVILDPFSGSGTTLLAARFLKRKYIGFDTNQEYVNLALRRLDSGEYSPSYASIDDLFEPAEASC